MMSNDIKTPEQIKIAMASIRMHGHIMVWSGGFVSGFAFGFWFVLLPRPETQLSLLRMLFAGFMNWLGALSWFPQLQAFYLYNSRVSLFSYFVTPLICGFILAAIALLSRFAVLSKLRGKAFIPGADKTLRGAGPSARSKSTADQLNDMGD